MKIAVYTLGCKVNQCDSDALITRLNGMGHDALATKDFSRPVDIFVINTCTVTHVSDKKSRQMISRAKKSGAKVAVCGCMAKAAEGKLEGVDLFFDARNPNDFFFDDLITTGKVTQRMTKTRAFIKIQDGCDRFCSYCIVPHVRGEVTSRPSLEILDEAREKIKNGALEIVLTGIQVACYGHDRDNLAGLVKEINALEGLRRFRLSSIDPTAINAEFLSAVAESDNLCSHFHLSLQSGCDKILESMNRRYTTEEFTRAVEQLRSLRENCAITTDIIVGFPGESFDDFDKGLRYVINTGFAAVHVFEFSAREGTPAAAFEGQIPPKEKAKRGRIMREAAENSQREFLQKQVGQTVEVLFEKSHGYTRNYCAVKSENHTPNTIKNMKITACTGEYLIGTE
jgi:threonylcarbamoyladenosine tRNA methylthiotransferase MtaB